MSVLVSHVTVRRSRCFSVESYQAPCPLPLPLNPIYSGCLCWSVSLVMSNLPGRALSTCSRSQVITRARRVPAHTSASSRPWAPASTPAPAPRAGPWPPTSSPVPEVGTVPSVRPMADLSPPVIKERKSGWTLSAEVNGLYCTYWVLL